MRHPRKALAQERNRADSGNKTNVKIKLNVRACGATLLIFKKLFKKGSEKPPIFLLYIEGNIQPAERRFYRLPTYPRYPHTHVR
jgi:hypothetical protein